MSDGSSSLKEVVGSPGLLVKIADELGLSEDAFGYSLMRCCQVMALSYPLTLHCLGYPLMLHMLSDDSICLLNPCHQDPGQEFC